MIHEAKKSSLWDSYKPENHKPYSLLPIRKARDKARTISQIMDRHSFSSPPHPHVLIFPVPAQGHVNSMLKLAELLSLAGVKVTFVNSVYNHDQLVRHTDIVDRFSQYPGFEFRTVWDGLPLGSARKGEKFMALFASMRLNTKPLFRELVVGAQPPIDCIIGDGVLSISALLVLAASGLIFVFLIWLQLVSFRLKVR